MHGGLFQSIQSLARYGLSMSGMTNYGTNLASGTEIDNFTDYTCALPIFLSNFQYLITVK
jgi:hypothetical protein